MPPAAAFKGRPVHRLLLRLRREAMERIHLQVVTFVEASVFLRELDDAARYRLSDTGIHVPVSPVQT